MEASSMVTGGDGELAITLQEQIQSPPRNPNALLPAAAAVRSIRPVSENLHETPTMSIQIVNTKCNYPCRLTTHRDRHTATQSVSTLVGYEEQPPDNLPTTEFDSQNSQNQVELASILVDMDNPNHDSGVHQGIAGQTLNSSGEEHNTTRLGDYMNPKDVAYLLRVYPTFIGLCLLKLIPGKHNFFPTANHFMIPSVVVYSMALLNFGILTLIYDRVNNSISSHQGYMSPGRYRILKDVFCILCIVAPILLLPVLLSAGSHGSPSPSPSSSPPH